MLKVAILGSTGSIGDSSIKVIEANKEKFSISLLAAFSNSKKIFEQCKKLKPEYVYLKEATASEELKENLATSGLNTSILDEKELFEIISLSEVDIIIAGIVGVAGLEHVYTAVEAGKKVLLANKESYVVAGELLNDLAEKNNSTILPIDSEHSAIHQCIAGKKNINQDIFKLLLTGSGGPFLKKDIKDFPYITPNEAIDHPIWSMGKKISVDSATMMNKGLEIIEAKWLFDLNGDKIDVLVHPQGIVHSMVEFKDGSIVAQMSVPDMKIPIAYSLGFPFRIKSSSKRLDLKQLGELSFSSPDLNKFPCIRIARDALNLGGTAPALLNAANEEAVSAFLMKKIGFVQISEIISFVMDKNPIKIVKGLNCVMEADSIGRETAINRINNL